MEQFDNMTVQQDSNKKFYLRAYEIPSHGVFTRESTKHEIPMCRESTKSTQIWLLNDSHAIIVPVRTSWLELRTVAFRMQCLCKTTDVFSLPAACSNYHL